MDGRTWKGRRRRVRIAILTADAVYEGTRARPGTESFLSQGMQRLAATARSVAAVLEENGHSVIPVPVTSALAAEISRAAPDMVFNTYFGPARRQDQAYVASLLEYAGALFSGGSAACHFIGLSKPLSKRVFFASGLPMARFFVASTPAEALSELDRTRLQFPLIVKASEEGEGIGLDERSIVRSRGELGEAADRVRQRFVQPAIVEEFLPGREFTVGVLDGAAPRVLPILEIKVARDGIFSFEAKARDLVEEVCPAELRAADRELMASLAVRAGHALGCRDYWRADFRLDAKGAPKLLEVNTLPGLQPGYSDITKMTGRPAWSMGTSCGQSWIARGFEPNIEMMKLTLSDFRKLPENTRGILQSLLYAAAAGGAAVAFLWLTNLVFRVTILRLSTLSPVVFVVGSFCVITLTSAASGILMSRVSPDTAGSGVPQLKAAYWKDLGFVRVRAVIVKFVAGVLTLGGGTSLGREGPSVFVGGGVASNLSAALGVPKTERRLPAATGAAASLAAAFNTPLAAITFVLEEMLNNEFSSRVLGGVVFAAVTGALIVQLFLGPRPAFSLPAVESVTWVMYVILPVVAAAASLIGVAFQTLTLSLRERVRSRSRLPTWLRPVGGAVITWVLGCVIFLVTGHTGVFGLGYNDLSLALTNNLTWQIAGLLVVAKLAATVASYGWGGSGGIFSPTLFLGGLTGFFLAGVAGIWIPLGPSDRIVLAAVGMSACFNAVVRAPLTALLIVFEMTHQFSMVPALMFCSLVSQAIGRLGGHHNFYDALLLQDGHELIRIKPPRDLKSWQNLAVSEIAKARPVVLPNLDPRSLQDILTRYPYQRFPLVVDGVVQGVVRRQEIETALAEKRAPRVDPAAFCSPDTSVREVGNLLIKSAAGAVLVAADAQSAPQSIVTLHDLLRVQASFSD